MSKELKKKSTKIFTWCQKERKHLPNLGRIGDKPKIKRIRCPKCKKNFEAIVIDCEDILPKHCWHVYLPPHKSNVKL